MNTATITLGYAVSLIDSSFNNFQDGLSDETIKYITYAVNNNLQIRDYLIGLPLEYDINTCSQFLDYLANSVDESERYAYDTVNAMFQYELGNSIACLNLLSNASKANPDYNLTKLIQRVVVAGWPATQFVAMRNDLANTVKEIIEESSDEVI